VIQARGGSKSVPGKNIRPLGQDPLIAYSIASALAAEIVTRLIVSTDDEEIASISRQYGAEVPFIRPAELATDNTPDFPVFEHALQWLDRHEGYRPQVVVQLRPTTPFRPRGLIDKAVRLLLDDPQADCVRGVTIPSQNPYKMWRLDDDGYLVPLLTADSLEPYNLPRQQLPKTLWQTGHIDVIRYETIMHKRSLTGQRIRPIIVDFKYCLDIDEQHDFELASWILNQGLLDIDMPELPGRARRKRSLPKAVSLVVFDFDGVFTDDRVWVIEDGREAVACNRRDGMGLALLRARGIEAAVLSTESNPVVTVRCQKLGLDCHQALEDKEAELLSLAQSKQVDLKSVIYVGNDINDLGCMRVAGYAVAVADAHPTALAQADFVLQSRGGYGAVRELCDIILYNLGG
jgi:YrbI family 3-deoxy-D-manno-octulosonate 8-phosphate phosphatase